MQEAAWAHAEELGFGHSVLYSKNLFWVLSRIKLNIKKNPFWGENITLKTRPNGAESLFAFRNYYFYDESDNEIASGTSSWLILDEKMLKPQRISSILDNLYKNDENQIILQKIKPEGVETKKIFKNPLYSDIDVNNHVNNAVYASWVTDLFDIDFFKENEIKSIQINYLSESKIGDNLEITLFDAGNNNFFAEGLDKNQNSKVFNSFIEWNKK